MRVFIEQQRFTQWWIYLIVLAPLTGVVVLIVSDLEKIQQDSEAIIGMSVALVVTILSMLLFLSMKLNTKIDQQGIHYNFFPFQRKSRLVNWKELNNCHVRGYKAVREYGGWGYHKGFGRSGKAINVKGDMGIQLELKNNKKLLIGTQKPNEAQQTIAHYFKKLDHDTINK